MNSCCMARMVTLKKEMREGSKQRFKMQTTNMGGALYRKEDLLTPLLVSQLSQQSPQQLLYGKTGYVEMDDGWGRIWAAACAY